MIYKWQDEHPKLNVVAGCLLALLVLTASFVIILNVLEATE